MVSAVLVDKIIALDERIFFAVNSGWKNNIFDFIFPKISFLGTTACLLLVCILLFLCGKRRARDASLMTMITLASTSFIVVTLNVLKYTHPSIMPR